jgi:hypothetical protein
VSTRLTDLARQRFLGDGVTTISWDSDSIKIVPLNLDGTLTTPGIKAVTGGITNATPMVVTSAAHGFQNGDILVGRGVVGNTAANNTFSAQNVAANTFELWTVPTSTEAAQQSTGNGAYVSGGTFVDLTLGSFLSDVDGARNAGATDTAALTGKTATNGVAFSSAGTLLAFPAGQTLYGFMTYKDTGVRTTSPLIHFGDGKNLVRVAEVYTAADTTVAVDPLEATIASGTSLIFTNGTTLVTTAPGAQGDVTLAVTGAGTGPRAGDTADVSANVSPNLPIVGNGGSIVLTPDSSSFTRNGWFRL